MVRDMLSILMDNIKDTDMWLGYAENCTDMNYKMWFVSHAKARASMLNEDYEYIAKEIGLLEKARSGDEIAEALLEHLNYQIKEIGSRLKMM